MHFARGNEGRPPSWLSAYVLYISYGTLLWMSASRSALKTVAFTVPPYVVHLQELSGTVLKQKRTEGTSTYSSRVP